MPVMQSVSASGSRGVLDMIQFRYNVCKLFKNKQTDVECMR